MKMIRILRQYMKGIRLSAAVLTVMMTWAMLNGVFVYGKIRNIGSDVDIIKSGDIERAAVLMYFPTQEDLITGTDREKAMATEIALEKESIVENVFSVRVANPVTYEGKGISIVLYEPEMLDYFPALKKHGVDFKGESSGCILGSQMFNKLEKGDTINLDFGKETAQFTVTDRIASPYRRISLSTANTMPIVENLFEEGDTILMSAAGAGSEIVNKLARRVEYDTNLIVVFTDDSSIQERENLMAKAAPEYLYKPFDEVIRNSEELIAATLKEELTQPIFLAISAAVAYLSTVVLTFKKKEYDTSILYLCGGSRWKCAAIHFAVCQIFSLIPLVFNVVFILSWPVVEWNYIDILMISHVWLRRILLYLYGKTMSIDISCLRIVFGYYLCTAAIAVAVAVVSMARHTPMTYLRGASR